MLLLLLLLLPLIAIITTITAAQQRWLASPDGAKVARLAGHAVFAVVRMPLPPFRLNRVSLCTPNSPDARTLANKAAR